MKARDSSALYFRLRPRLLSFPTRENGWIMDKKNCEQKSTMNEKKGWWDLEICAYLQSVGSLQSLIGNRLKKKESPLDGQPLQRRDEAKSAAHQVWVRKLSSGSPFALTCEGNSVFLAVVTRTFTGPIDRLYFSAHQRLFSSSISLLPSFSLGPSIRRAASCSHYIHLVSSVFISICSSSVFPTSTLSSLYFTLLPSFSVSRTSPHHLPQLLSSSSVDLSVRRAASSTFLHTLVLPSLPLLPLCTYPPPYQASVIRIAPSITLEGRLLHKMWLSCPFHFPQVNVVHLIKANNNNDNLMCWLYCVIHISRMHLFRFTISPHDVS